MKLRLVHVRAVEFRVVVKRRSTVGASLVWELTVEVLEEGLGEPYDAVSHVR